MKFVLYIDYKAMLTNANNERFSYTAMTAKTLEEAIAEADKLWDAGIYLMRIMKKTSKGNAKYGVDTYEAVLCRRSYGWHLNNKDNSENHHAVNHFKTKYGEWFEYC